MLLWNVAGQCIAFGAAFADGYLVVQSDGTVASGGGMISTPVAGVSVIALLAADVSKLGALTILLTQAGIVQSWSYLTVVQSLPGGLQAVVE